MINNLLECGDAEKGRSLGRIGGSGYTMPDTPDTRGVGMQRRTGSVEPVRYACIKYIYLRMALVGFVSLSYYLVEPCLVRNHSS